MKSRMKSIRLCWATAVALLVAAPAQGHQPWVLTGDARLAPNQSTTDEVYFGHSFPGGELLAADRIATAAVVTPAGEFETVESGGRNPFESPPLARPGTYVIGIEQTSGYWTRTPKGGLPRQELDDAVHCSFSTNGAATLVSVRDAGPGRRHDADLPAAARALGHRLEILPQIDPLGLDAGDTLPVEVRFEGNPFAVALMVFHADSGEEPYLIVETDAGGRADVVLDGPAPWMLSARAEWSYPNPAVCDIPAFNASMTFPQRPSR